MPSTVDMGPGHAGLSYTPGGKATRTARALRILTDADANGEFPVPQGPGLGVEYDWDLIGRHRTDLAEYK
jgi:L-alanine-DL-glutamate epimerase-like enolase superfamily enzyme